MEIKAFIKIFEHYSLFSTHCCYFEYNCIRICTESGTLQVIHFPSNTAYNGFLSDCGPVCLGPYDRLYLTRWDLALISNLRANNGPFVFLPFLNNHSNCCLLLTKFLADGLVAFSRLVQVYDLSLIFFSSSFPMMVKRLEGKRLILWTGVFYMHNELRLWVIS